MDEMFMFALRNGFVRVEIISPAGTILLDGERFKLLDGVIGLGVADVEHSTHALASGGGVHRHSRYVEGEMFLPLSLKGRSPADLYERRRELEAVILPSVGQVLEVRVTTVHTGAVRSRFVRYAKGLNYTLGGQDSHFTWQKIGLSLTYVDPWWYGVLRDEVKKIVPSRKPFLSGLAPASVRENVFPNPWPTEPLTWGTFAGADAQTLSVDGGLRVDVVPGSGTPHALSSAVPVNVGSVYSIGFNVETSPGVSAIRVAVWEYTGSSLRHLVDSGYQAPGRFEFTTMPATTDEWRIQVQLWNNADGWTDAAPGEWAVFNQFIIEAGDTVGPFFDGDTADTEDTDYSWTGEPNASTSIERVGGVSHAIPFFPVLLSASTVQGAYELTVQGDADVWPTWAIRGPGEDLLIQDEDTGERIFITGTIDENVTIVTRPQEQDVFSQSSTQGGLWDRVSLDSVLFSLRPGLNRVRVSMVNGTAESEIRLSYRERFKAGH